jgi:Ca2+-transporting ATPase
MFGCLAVVAVVAAISLARGAGAVEVLLGSVSLAVAAVPESLAAIVTIALAVGVQRMAARNVLVRRLPAVETLGGVTVICTDKTGTLTTGEMEVRESWGPDPTQVLRVAAACCDADLTAEGGTGDRTELALLQAAAKLGITREALERDLPRTGEVPFDREAKWMAVRRADGRWYVKGAAEALALLCRAPLPEADQAALAMASRGLRVLGVATGEEETVSQLQFVGLVGLADPPRPEAIAAVAQAKKAGILTVMITGDHEVTAKAIAGELGLLDQGRPADEVVHARATAAHKLEIVKALKAQGEVVAMTGDGVNDAPALREAHVGVAMGRTGTEVTREAAAVVLSDDNYASIVAGVREGRGIYDNIRKTLSYLLTGNAGQLMLMLAAAVWGLPAPVLPLQLLWINMVVDGLTALALSLDPVADDALARPPRAPSAPVLEGSQWAAIAAFGALEAGVALAVYAAAIGPHGLSEARTLGFSTLVFSELFRAFAARSPTLPIWKVGLTSNLRLLGVVAAATGLQIALVSTAAGRVLLAAAPIPLSHLALALGAGLVPFAAIELSKALTRLIRSAAKRGRGAAGPRRARPERRTV